MTDASGAGRRPPRSSSAPARAAWARPPWPPCWPWRARARAAGPWWSPSTRPSGWPTPSGLEGLTNEPGRIEGDWPGELYGAHARHQAHLRRPRRPSTPPTPEQAERILENRFYRTSPAPCRAPRSTWRWRSSTSCTRSPTSTSSSSTPRRPATPSTSSTPPARLTRFLDHRLYRVLMAPTRGVVKAVNVAAQAFLRTVAKVVGAEVIDDAIAFFQAFEGMEEGFRDRAARRRRAARGRRDRASCWSPRPGGTPSRRPCSSPTRSTRRGIAISALIVNRMHPRFGAGPGRGGPGAGPDASPGTALGGLYANLADFQLIAGREEATSTAWSEGRPTPVVRVPVPAHRRPRPRRPRRARRAPVADRRPRLIAGDLPGAGVKTGSRGTPVAVGQGGGGLVDGLGDGTIRSKPVVWSRRVRVGRPQATATSPPASRARRMPPMSAPRPAESMNGTSDRSISRCGASVELGQRLAERSRRCRRRAHLPGGRACSRRPLRR